MKIITIGRSTDCDIVFPDNVISRRHALLKIYATGKMEIVDVGQNGTYINGIRLTPNKAYPVTRKDVISFAHIRQLEWSGIPNPYRYYRYGLWAVLALLLLSGVILFLNRPAGPVPAETESVPPAPLPPEDTSSVPPSDSSDTESGTKKKPDKKALPPDFFGKKSGKKTPSDTGKQSEEDTSQPSSHEKDKSSEEQEDNNENNNIIM